MKPVRLLTLMGSYASLSVLIFLLISPLPVLAANSDEVVEMTNAGLSPQIIIEVIDATGFDDPLDTDTFIYLLEYEVDYEVIEYLLQFAEDDEKLEVSAHERWGSEDDRHPNYAGGPGFNHDNEYRSSGTGYWQGYDDYYESERSAEYYYDNGVTVYRPPVYAYSGHHNYYYDPYRTYTRNRGSWYNGTYVIYNNDYCSPFTSTYGRNRYYYDDYWNDNDWDYHPRWNDPWHANWYDGFSRYSGLNGSICYDRYNDRWYSDWDAFYRRGGFGLRISF